MIKKFKLKTPIWKEIHAIEGLWGENIGCGHTVYIRLNTKFGVRPFWDIMLTVLHELAHGHPHNKDYGGKMGHG